MADFDLQNSIEFEIRQRAKKMASSAGILLAAGLLYYGFVSLTGLYIPCIFRLITGWKCPGCGVSHMFVHLAHFQIKGAFSDNAFLLILFPFAVFYVIYRAKRYIFNNDRTYHPWENTALIAVAVIAVVFGVVRNIVGI